MENIRRPDHHASLRTTASGVSLARWIGELLLTRVLPAVFFFVAVRGKIIELISFLGERTTEQEALGNFGFLVSIGSRVSVILFLTLMGTLFVVRQKPLKKASGLSPRLMAIAGTFLMSALTLFPRAELGTVQTVLATALLLVGSALSAFVLFRLGRSFSLMAEARKLVTTGPYALVRHPLYLAEEIAVVGALLQFLSIWTFLIFVVHLAIQMRRMRNEEGILRDVFPDYQAYEARTPRLIPGLY